MRDFSKTGMALTRLAVSVAAFTVAGHAMAAPIDVGNPDIQLRWDNTLRYNLGIRAQKQERALGESPAQQISNNKFDRGDVVTNRLDILSEIDFIYKGEYGARVSAAGWYDDAYSDRAESLPQYEGTGAYPDDEYTSTVKRFYMGPSGEILDAFVFGRLNFGDVPVRFRLGQHALFWGESLFSFAHSVAYGQSPMDLRKATAIPGTEAKELYRPLNQLSISSPIADNISLAAYYQFEWDSSRMPEGGTYFGSSDFLFSGGTRVFLSPGVSIPYIGDHDEPDNSGAWGTSLRWRSGALNSTFGFYYREFADTLPNIVADYAGGTPTRVFSKYADDVKLFGVSMSKQVGAAAVGAELLRRENTALNSVGMSPDFARGDTWHALANMVIVNGETALWDSSTLQAELTYSYLDRVTKNGQYFNKEGSAQCNSASPGKNRVKDGCSTRDALGFQVSFAPVWYQAINGVDLSLPMNLSVGLHGNSPVSSGGNEGAGSFSVGIGADYLARYKFDLTYNGFFGSISKDINGLQETANGGLLRDRGWVSLTAKASF